MPVVGFLRSTTVNGSAHLVAAFLPGLKEAGFVDGQNVTAGRTIKMIAYRRWRPTWSTVR
jgi:hypothetical protein